jgi:hypothetical protein
VLVHPAGGYEVEFVTLTGETLAVEDHVATGLAAEHPAEPFEGSGLSRLQGLGALALADVVDEGAEAQLRAAAHRPDGELDREFMPVPVERADLDPSLRRLCRT